jgi:membrane protease YdiL (CAAX protease family)
MRPIECDREQEIVEAVASGLWPDGCAEDLRNHIASCGVCNDVVVVALALQEERAGALGHVRVPPAGLVWWRAELRARQQAARAAERPMTLIQAFAAAGTIGVTLALLVGIFPSLPEGLFFLNALRELGRWPLLLMLGALIVAAPVALYFVFSDE